MCLQANLAATARCFLANETTSQTVGLPMDTGLPPALTINAGISRGRVEGPPGPLARVGAVYFDDLLAMTTDGPRSLTDGASTTMVASGGSQLAVPVKLNGSAFKVIDKGA